MGIRAAALVLLLVSALVLVACNGSAAVHPESGSPTERGGGSEGGSGSM